ncbi:chaplin [Streptomyces oceani]|uniref:Chaplin domain-containing protein n=1 Tax=Streptomyces oceani TaxID=1075402 RepID=A0A1E7KH69_9ACTN|nr:chaplin [Streptomyces oceani]OEV03223.1 hypothetical protein AN216_12865 [Streptomyces oceani]
MRQVSRTGLITVAAAGSVLALSGGTAFADSTAEGGSANSPGLLSGNTAQVPIDADVNVCGNTVDVVGLLNPAFGNECANDSTEKPEKTDKPAPKPEKPQPDKPEEKTPEEPREQPKEQPQAAPQQAVEPQLAETGGSYDLALGMTLGTGLLLGGGVLYRRARVGRR